MPKHNDAYLSAEDYLKFVIFNYLLLKSYWFKEFYARLWEETNAMEDWN